jgi:glutaredoxin 3
MAKVEIYTTAICPFCDRAKALLRKKGISYDEIDVGADPDLRQAMVERTGGRRTVPQIFIDGVPVGGSDDLYALEAKGLLDALLCTPTESG